tara:strand:+ start:263 stop:427 length:165 start_codon:yes stop_codon:yes gene_type:complete
MPSVGTGKNKKTFPYTPKGTADAKKLANKTGSKMKNKKPIKKMMGGGKVGRRKY